MKRTERPLWTCPKCGNEFVTKKLWHSCVKFDMDYHFKGKNPALRKAFEKFRAMVERCGPILVTPQKTRIVFQVRVRFAGVVPRKSYLLAGISLPRPHPDKRFAKIVRYAPNWYGHYFRLEKPEDLDASLMPYIRESYNVGQQNHLTKKQKRGSAR